MGESAAKSRQAASGANRDAVSKPIRICYVCSILANQHSGTERHLLRLVRSLDRDKFDPHLVVLQRGRFTDAWNDPRVPLRALGYHAIYRPRDWVRILGLARWLRRQRFQIVELHSPEAQLVGTLAARLAGVPVVVSARRNLGYEYNWKTRLQTGLANRRATCFLANSERVVQRISQLEGLDPARFHLIRNGVDLAAFDRDREAPVDQQFQTARQCPIVVAVAANLRPVKNLPLLLRAARRVVDAGHDAAFVLLGAGPDDAALRELARSLDVDRHVFFLGARVPVAPYLARSDVGCLTSDSEGFSSALLEYMAAGLPVVATQVGGAAEAVDDGRTGMLVPAGDEQKLSEALIELIQNQELRRQMGRDGRQRVETEFSLERELRQYESLYRDRIAERV